MLQLKSDSLTVATGFFLTCVYVQWPVSAIRSDPALLPRPHRHGRRPPPPLAWSAKGDRRLPHLPLPDASARGRGAAGRLHEPPRQSHDAGLLPRAQLPIQVLGFVPPGGAQHRLLDRGAEDLGRR